MWGSEMDYLCIMTLVVICMRFARVHSESYYASSNLTAIPVERYLGDPSLYIEDNLISYVQKDAFLSYTNLRTLTLLRVGLRYIEEGAFNGQDKLETFRCTQNPDFVLPSDLGPPTKSLVKTIWWASLQSQVVISFPYFAAFENLSFLNIGGNDVSTFQPNFLPRSLLYISLIYCKLPVFPRFALYAPLLETINMGHCGLQTMTTENVTGLNDLTSLHLNSNKLIKIPDLSFMTKLKTIELQHNQLASVPDMYDLPLKTLKLAGNTLVCDQSLCWIRMWHWMKMTRIPSDEPICAASFEMARMKLMEIDPADMQCYTGGWKK